MTEKQRRINFQKLWIDLGPKMVAKKIGRDFEAEELFMLGWAIGIQDGTVAGVNEATSMLQDIRQGKTPPDDTL